MADHDKQFGKVQMVRMWRTTHEQARSLCGPLGKGLGRGVPSFLVDVYDAAIKVLTAKLAEQEKNL